MPSRPLDRPRPDHAPSSPPPPAGRPTATTLSAGRRDLRGGRPRGETRTVNLLVLAVGASGSMGANARTTCTDQGRPARPAGRRLPSAGTGSPWSPSAGPAPRSAATHGERRDRPGRSSTSRPAAATPLADGIQRALDLAVRSTTPAAPPACSGAGHRRPGHRRRPGPSTTPSPAAAPVRPPRCRPSSSTSNPTDRAGWGSPPNWPRHGRPSPCPVPDLGPTTSPRSHHEPCEEALPPARPLPARCRLRRRRRRHHRPRPRHRPRAQQPMIGPATASSSLSPSLTELLYAVGAGDQVIAVDSNSDYPPRRADHRPRWRSTPTSRPSPPSNPTSCWCRATGTASSTPSRASASTRCCCRTPSDIDDVYLQITRIGEQTGHVDEAVELAEQLESELESHRRPSARPHPGVHLLLRAERRPQHSHAEHVHPARCCGWPGW